MTPATRLHDGRLELRPMRQQVVLDGRLHHLGGRAFDLLQVLIDNRHRVVARTELLERVWPGLAVEPNNLQVQVWALRRLLGREAIVTVARRGYRYAGLAAAPRPSPDAGTRQPPVLPDGETQRPRLRWRARAGA